MIGLRRGRILQYVNRHFHGILIPVNFIFVYFVFSLPLISLAHDCGLKTGIYDARD